MNILYMLQLSAEPEDISENSCEYSYKQTDRQSHSELERNAFVDLYKYGGVA